MGLNKKRWDVFISGKGWDDIEYAAVKKAVEKRATFGSSDAVSDALTLFIDFVGILVRLLIILLKNSGKKKKQSRR